MTSFFSTCFGSSKDKKGTFGKVLAFDKRGPEFDGGGFLDPNEISDGLQAGGCVDVPGVPDLVHDGINFLDDRVGPAPMVFEFVLNLGEPGEDGLAFVVFDVELVCVVLNLLGGLRSGMGLADVGFRSLEGLAPGIDVFE